METLSLEKFLERYNLPINDFISFMDKSQIKYNNLDDFIKNVKPCNWIMWAFSWVIKKIPNYVTVVYDWRDLNNEWNNYLNNYPNDKINFFNKLVKNKLDIQFE